MECQWTMKMVRKKSSYLDLFGKESQNLDSFKQKFDFFPTFSKALNRKGKNKREIINCRKEFSPVSS